MSLTSAMQLCIAINLTHSRVINTINSALSCHGISFSELNVMHQLSQSPQLTLRRSELAANVGLSASGVTRLLLPLEKIGLIEKRVNARDARVSLVKLSEAGQTLLANAMLSFQHCAANLTEAMSSQQVNDSLQLFSNVGTNKR